ERGDDEARRPWQEQRSPQDNPSGEAEVQDPCQWEREGECEPDHRHRPDECTAHRGPEGGVAEEGLEVLYAHEAVIPAEPIDAVERHPEGVEDGVEQEDQQKERCREQHYSGVTGVASTARWSVAASGRSV